jgi:hypothetical protein
LGLVRGGGGGGGGPPACQRVRSEQCIRSVQRIQGCKASSVLIVLPTPPLSYPSLCLLFSFYTSYGIRHMYSRCTTCTQSLYARSVLSIRSIFTVYHCLFTVYSSLFTVSVYSMSIHCLCTYALSIYCLFTVYSLSIHCLFTLYSLSIHYSLSMHCLFTIHGLSTVYSLSNRCLFTVYSLSIHSLRPVYVLYSPASSAGYSSVSSFTFSAHSASTHRSSGQSRPCHTCTRRVGTLSTLSMSAPWASSTSQAEACPPFAAFIRAVEPFCTAAHRWGIRRCAQRHGAAATKDTPTHEWDQGRATHRQ